MLLWVIPIWESNHTTWNRNAQYICSVDCSCVPYPAYHPVNSPNNLLANRKLLLAARLSSRSIWQFRSSEASLGLVSLLLVFRGSVFQRKTAWMFSHSRFKAYRSRLRCTGNLVQKFLRSGEGLGIRIRPHIKVTGCSECQTWGWHWAWVQSATKASVP